MFISFPYFHKNVHMTAIFKTWQVDRLPLKKLQIIQVVLK